MKRPRYNLSSWLLSGVAFAACASAAGAVDPATPTGHSGTPTFSGEIASIVYNNCTPCHRPEGGAPFSFMSYEEISKRARLIARVTESGQMPPWKAEKGDVAFMGERHLSDHDKQALIAWFEAGAPLGDEAAAPPAPTFVSGWTNGEPDMILEMENDFEIPADGPDIYRGFVVRIPDLPEGTYLKGIDYRPRALGAAHHTLFSLDSTGESRLRDEASERPGFGGMEGNLSLNRIGGWAVGSVQHPYPDGVAIAIKPGTDLVLNTHFHPSGKPEVERAQIGLYLTDEAPTRHAVTLDAPFGFGVLKGIRIPAGEKDHLIRESFVVPTDAELMGIAPHAHYLATRMRADATFPDGRTMQIISVPQWDFAWQEQYRLSEPLHLPKGTRIDMEFHYDNSADNPANPHNPPQEVTFGPESTDEMACMTLLFTTQEQETMDQLKQGYVAWVKDSIDKADLSIIARSANQQRRDALDLNSDGKITLGEVYQRILVIRRRLANADPENLHLQILPVMGARMFKSVLLPWLLPRALVVLVCGVAGILLVRYAVGGWRKRRKAQIEAPQSA